MSRQSSQVKYLSHIFFALLSTLSYAASDLELGRAAGGYLSSAVLLQETKQSKCGFVLKKRLPTFEERYSEVKQRLPKKNFSELDEAIKNGWRHQMQEQWRRFIDGYLQKSMESGIEQSTACGMLLSTVGVTASKGESEWRRLYVGR